MSHREKRVSNHQKDVSHREAGVPDDQKGVADHEKRIFDPQKGVSDDENLVCDPLTPAPEGQNTASKLQMAAWPDVEPTVEHLNPESWAPGWCPEDVRPGVRLQIRTFECPRISLDDVALGAGDPWLKSHTLLPRREPERPGPRPRTRPWEPQLAGAHPPSPVSEGETCPPETVAPGGEALAPSSLRQTIVSGRLCRASDKVDSRQSVWGFVHRP